MDKNGFTMHADQSKLSMNKQRAGGLEAERRKQETAALKKLLPEHIVSLPSDADTKPKITKNTFLSLFSRPTEQDSRELIEASE